ncbi:unnamed protein product [Rotaria sp. Silwood2]|nr:unnamed protein product [Rotaria sp. Silwood2]CAF4076747.1 unnamed protein product [Rotaria sp. Silwood2]
MHIFFSGIGGSGIGPLSLIALRMGYDVSGSDKRNSDYIEQLRKNGKVSIVITQSYDSISKIHMQNPIDWFVYSSAVSIEQPNSPEFQFCADHGIMATKRDKLIKHIIDAKQLQLIAVAGSHGKTTTTAMIIWLFKALNIPISYSIGGKISFGDIGTYHPKSTFFVYEADEYDRNFLAFQPYIAAITGTTWDHPDTYPTELSYIQAFRDFVKQSKYTIVWQSGKEQLDIQINKDTVIIQDDDSHIMLFCLIGEVNRRNAWQAVWVVHIATNISISELIEHVNRFPGVSRRFEQIRPNLYTDYAHTPAKIRGALQVAHEIAGNNVVAVYEGFQNTRQHFMKNDLCHLFDDVKHVYIVPIYLAREDPGLEILSPNTLRTFLNDQTQGNTTPSQLDETLKTQIQQHINSGDLVLGLSAGSSNSLDEWLRRTFELPI